METLPDLEKVILGRPFTQQACCKDDLVFVCQKACTAEFLVALCIVAPSWKELKRPPEVGQISGWCKFVQRMPVRDWKCR